jgi:hypothetical protein
MLHLSDKELDRLSQEAAKQYDPGLEHSPGSWDKLEQQLTGIHGKTRPSLFRGYRRIPFLYAPIVALLVGVGYFLVKQSSAPHGPANTRSDTASLAGPANSSPPDAVLRVMPSTASPGATDDKSPKTDPSPKIGIPQNNSTTKNSTAKKEGPSSSSVTGDESAAAAERAATAAGQKAGRNLAGMNGKNTSPQDRSGRRLLRESIGNNANDQQDHHNDQPGKRRLKTGKYSMNNSLNNSLDNSPDNSLKNSLNNSPGNPHKNPSRNIGNPVAQFGPSHSLITPSPSPGYTRPVIDDSGLKAVASNNRTAKKTPIGLGKKKDRSLHTSNPLQIGLLYAPDFTTVKSVVGDKPGHSLGLTVGYHVLNRLSVNTGFLWTHKNYTALASDFHPPSGSWLNNNNMVQLHYVEGSANMLEIPLNIRYDFKLADNSLFYLTGGVSSYLVGDENCLYFYENFGMNRRAPEKETDPQNYWFAALNLAMGIEKPISTSFSIQAEPYLKLPLSGVGIGNVQLNSFGINFSLKYTPVLGKSRH